MAGLLDTLWPYIPPGFREAIFGGNDFAQQQPSPGMPPGPTPPQRMGLLGPLMEMSPGADMRDAVDYSQSASQEFAQGNIGKGLLDTAYIPASLLGVLLPGSASQYRQAGGAVTDALESAAMKTDPAIESLAREWAAQKIPAHRKHFANNAISAGRLTEAQRLPLYAEIAKIEGVRAQRGAHLKFDPLVIAAQNRQATVRRLKDEKNLLAQLNNTMALPVAESWSKPFRDRVEAAARLNHNVASEVARATLDAITRRARQVGWQIRYSSPGRDGRVTSRYLVHPSGTEIRLSDHDVPLTPERAFNRENYGGPRWVEFNIMDADKSWTVNDYMAAIDRLATERQ